MCLQAAHVGITVNYSQENMIILLYQGGGEKGTSKCLYNCRFRIVSTRWKDSKTLQFISSLRKLEKQNSSDVDVKNYSLCSV